MLNTIVCDPVNSDADATLEVSASYVEARCSLWWTRTPAYPNERVGLIGQYSASGLDASLRLIAHACELLKDKGCTLVVGPMDGSTWKKYRFITQHGKVPPFFLEPENPPEYPSYFEAAGFETIATYTSAISDGLEVNDQRAQRVEARLRKEGFRIRALDLSDFENELHALYEISSAAFADNFLYQPISEEEFVALYRPIRNYIRPELVLFAERDGDPAAFLFAIPDRHPGNFIIKTVAAHPRFAGRGLGTVLIQHANRGAAALGYERAIHALMHEENQSTRISARQAQVFRRYTLFAKRLTAPKVI